MTHYRIEEKTEFKKALKIWTNGTTTRYKLTQYQTTKGAVIGYDKKGDQYIIELV